MEQIQPTERKPVFNIRPFNNRAFLLANQNFCELFAKALDQRKRLSGPIEDELDLLADKLSDIESIGKKRRTDVATEEFDVQPVFIRYAVIGMTTDLTRRIMSVLEDRQEENGYFEPPLFNLLQQSEEVLYALRQEQDKVSDMLYDIRSFYGRLYIIANERFCSALATVVSQRNKNGHPFEESLDALVCRLQNPTKAIKKRAKRSSDECPEVERPKFDVKYMGHGDVCACLNAELGKRVARVLVDRKYEVNDLDPAMTELMKAMEDQLYQLRTFREQRQNRWSDE